MKQRVILVHTFLSCNTELKQPESPPIHHTCTLAGRLTLPTPSQPTTQPVTE